jgi:hypothetical protein
MSTFELQNAVSKSLQDVMKISLFSFFKTGNPVIDTIISTILITCLTYFVNLAYSWPFQTVNLFALRDDIWSLFYKKNVIILEGKRSSVVTQYNSQLTNSSSFTDGFKATFREIITNVEGNQSITEIKEFFIRDEYDSNSNSNSNASSNEEAAFDGYIISQSSPFLYNKELQIYGRTTITKQETQGEKSKSSAMVDIITIQLYSYVTPLSEMQKHIQKNTEKYLDTVANSRVNKQFIYTLCKTKYDDSRFECWKEYVFESTRSFDNIFFEGKENILGKIKFFLDNPQWYYDMGIPYTLGFGLHGPPGTGKTSFFKCLANLTGRHLVVLSLKLIKTKSQLDQFFFENRYTYKNRENSVGFDKKIIILEDIDCLGDIVLKRNKTAEARPEKKTRRKTGVETAVQMILDKNDEQSKAVEAMCSKQTDDEPITLDDILNLWDGLKETPGRILGISSNHYDKLDPALIRPGRIDITLKLDLASRQTIGQMYNHYYKKHLTQEQLASIPDRKYSPAEIINDYMLFKDEPENFIKKLQNL